MAFLQNLAALLPATGIDDAPVAWWLAGVDWPSDAARDHFASILAGPGQPAPPAPPGAQP